MLLFVIVETKFIFPSIFFRALVNGFNCSMFLIIVVLRFFKSKSLMLNSPVKIGVDVKKFEIVPTVWSFRSLQLILIGVNFRLELTISKVAFLNSGLVKLYSVP